MKDSEEQYRYRRYISITIAYQVRHSNLIQKFGVEWRRRRGKDRENVDRTPRIALHLKGWTHLVIHVQNNTWRWAVQDLNRCREENTVKAIQTDFLEVEHITLIIHLLIYQFGVANNKNRSLHWIPQIVHIKFQWEALGRCVGADLLGILTVLGNVRMVRKIR